MGQGSSQQNLSKDDVLSFILILPIIQEQTKIANFLSAIDEKINHCQGQIDQTTIWKKGLLQQLFV
jgi:type I restriction enzyme S subunit